MNYVLYNEGRMAGCKHVQIDSETFVPEMLPKLE